MMRPRNVFLDTQVLVVRIVLLLLVFIFSAFLCQRRIFVTVAASEITLQMVILKRGLVKMSVIKLGNAMILALTLNNINRKLYFFDGYLHFLDTFQTQ